MAGFVVKNSGSHLGDSTEALLSFQETSVEEVIRRMTTSSTLAWFDTGGTCGSIAESTDSPAFPGTTPRRMPPPWHPKDFFNGWGESGFVKVQT
jgi:hypothetical protein